MGPPAELRLAALALLVGVVGCVGPEAGDPPGGAVEVDAPMSGAETTDGLKRAGEFVTTRVDQRYLACVGVDGVETGLGDSGAPVLWSGEAGLLLYWRMRRARR